MRNETYLPAQEASKEQGARLSRPHDDQGRPKRAPGSQGARAQEAVCLIHVVPDRAAADYRLGRRFSLGRNKQYRIVYRRGNSFPGRLMVLVYMRDRALRVGFSVTSKVGGAVLRNRLRRWMHEDFRMLRTQVKPGRYVFVARTAAAQADHQEMKAEMIALLERARLLRPDP
jgi:ribonuclease P protein component